MQTEATSVEQLEYCSIERAGALCIVTLDRPEAMNSLHEAADIELDGVWSRFESDPQLHVAILTGAGERAFCTGNDLKSLAANGGVRRFPRSGFGGLSTRTDRRKPIIAAVNGIAMGGGFELCLACDLIIAARNAVFALPEPKVGRCAALGGAQYLARTIGLPRAMGMLLTGRRVDADEALSLGFLTAITEGDVMAAARDWAQQILQCSPAAIRATRQLARQAALGPQFLDVLRAPTDLDQVRLLRESEDFREGPRAFAERRSPVWTS